MSYWVIELLCLVVKSIEGNKDNFKETTSPCFNGSDGYFCHIQIDYNLAVKKLFALTIGVFILHGTHAQDFRMGLKGAFNSTWLINSNVAGRDASAEYQASWGTHAGLAFNYYFDESIALSVDVLYSTHAQRFFGDCLDTDSFAYTGKMITNYLDIPLLLRITSEGGPYVEFGPQVGILLNAKEDYERVATSGEFFSYKARDYKKDFNAVDISAVLGFGYDIPLSDNMFINLGLRFSYGFTDAMVKNPEEDFLITFNHSEFCRLASFDSDEVFKYLKTNRAYGGLMLGFIFQPD